MTTETMIERLARAICKAQGDDWEREGPVGLMEAYGPSARAALQALREPTEEMVKAACSRPRDEGLEDEFYRQWWSAIDAALQEKT